MSDRLDELAPATVAAVAFAPVDDLAAHHRWLGLRFPLLSDSDRNLYRRFDLGRGRFTEVWNPGTLLLYARLIRRGRRLRRPNQDTRQLGGDFVIDGAGRLAAAFRPSSPDDRPTVDDLIQAIQRVCRP